MNPSDLFMTTTSSGSRFDGSAGDGKTKVSEFVTVQSLANFAAMTGAITAATNLIVKVFSQVPPLAVAYVLAMAWGVASVWMSWDGLKVNGKVTGGATFTACFLAFLNSLILAGAVVGTSAAATTLAAAFTSSAH